MTIKQRQHLLAYLGYYVMQVDGDWGSGSVAACKAFQKEYGLTADGICGPQTEKALKGAVAGTMVKIAVPESGTGTKAETPTASGTWVSKHFSREEFRCQCGGKYCNGFPAEPSPALLVLADNVREHFGKPATITSGLRCERHNAGVSNASANSRHMYGKAMDFRIAGVSADTVLAYVKTLPGVNFTYHIPNTTCIHMDVK